MHDSKIIVIIKEIFKDEGLDDEDINAILASIKENNLKKESEIKEFLEELKEKAKDFIIDDSEFDEK